MNDRPFPVAAHAIWTKADSYSHRKQVTQLSMVICAAYHWDDAWAGRIFPDPQDVPFIRITHPDKERNGAFWPTPVNDPNRLPGAMNCAAWIPGGYGTMHMKFMLVSVGF